MSVQRIITDWKINLTGHSQRLDISASSNNPEYSRSQIQTWIKNGKVTINNKVIASCKHLVKNGDEIILDVTISPPNPTSAQPIALDIIFEDEEIIIINKPPGLVVHPGAGQPDQTLVNGLLYHDANLGILPRAGLIHRIDKDTSGLLCVAKNLKSYNHLIKKMQNKEINRTYQALVHGHVPWGGTINLPVGRHPRQRTKMAVTTTGKPAITHYTILKHFTTTTLLKVQLDTGRTHQIRVHFQNEGWPLVGDPTYGSQCQSQKNSPEFSRQALHAWNLILPHPRLNQQMSFIAPIPKDLTNLIEGLQSHR